jgi:hypothetical protein
MTIFELKSLKHGEMFKLVWVHINYFINKVTANNQRLKFQTTTRITRFDYQYVAHFELKC